MKLIQLRRHHNRGLFSFSKHWQLYQRTHYLTIYFSVFGLGWKVRIRTM